MKQEAGTFFIMALVGLIGAYIYISSLGGFATTSHPHASQPSDYHSLAYQDAINAGIDPTLYQRQINEESGFNPSAVSSEGAIGIAQIMPATAQSWDVNPWDPVASLSVAANHMAWYQGHYGSFAKALACYNAGTAALDSAMARYGASWQIGLPAETQRYIMAIIGSST